MKLDSSQNLAVSCSFEPDKYVGLNAQLPLTFGTRAIGILEAGIPMGFLIAVYGLFAMPLKAKIRSA
jgi:hypothetical protein